ncbi:OmpA family protein [uncultured Sunxiuqinia sp.]|uniref:OmpA family protein n=1 Tax=uncultured Sunxiuqinia sp. TaxID=1573825 RepID=UPI0030D8376D
MADKSYDNFAFVEAIDLYEFAFSKDSSNSYVIRRLANANHHVGNTEEAEKWLELLVSKGDAQPEDLFNYSQALKSNGKYPEAEKWLTSYAELRPDDRRVDTQNSLLEYIQLLHRDPKRYSIRPVSLNTSGSELGVAFYGEKLVFSSTKFINGTPTPKYKWNELPYFNLFIGDQAPNGDIVNVKEFASKLATSYHDGPVSFDPKSDRVYITRNNVGKGGSATKGKGGEINLKILFGGKEEDDWEYRGEFSYNSDDYSTGHPSIDTTGQVMYFASDMPGGYGGTDIYYAVFNQGFWSNPVNLGPKVNTAENELFPFISYDGTLYFSSNGHPGLGGLDIYSAIPENGVFNQVHNMGYPLNSPKDDFSFVLDEAGTAGYFSSNRNKGRGNDDIYFVRLTHVPVFIRGVAKDFITGKPLAGATISLVNEFADTLATQQTKRTGEFEFEVHKGRNYIVHGLKEFYQANHTLVPTKKLRAGDETFVQLSLEMEEEIDDGSPEPLYMEEEDGEPLQVHEIRDIDFYVGDWVVNSDVAHTINELIQYLIEFPDMEIRIETHTDSRGDEEENLLLSKRRAKAIFDYIRWKGIDPLRVGYEGYGETRLLNKCDDGVDCSEAEHQANNRNIVKVVKKGEYRGKRAIRNTFYF